MCGAGLFGRGGLKRQARGTGSRLSALGSALGSPRLSALGSRLSALGSRLSALGSRLSALGSRLSALGSRLSALGSRLSALIMRAAGPSRFCQAFFRAIHDFFQTPRRPGRETARASTKQAPLCAGVTVGSGPRFSTAVRTVLSLATHLRAGRCAPSRNVLQWQPLPAVPPATLHSTLLTTESGAAIPCRTEESSNDFNRDVNWKPNVLRPLRQSHKCIVFM